MDFVFGEIGVETVASEKSSVHGHHANRIANTESNKDALHLQRACHYLRDITQRQILSTLCNVTGMYDG